MASGAPKRHLVVVRIVAEARSQHQSGEIWFAYPDRPHVGCQRHHRLQAQLPGGQAHEVVVPREQSASVGHAVSPSVAPDYVAVAQLCQDSHAHWEQTEERGDCTHWDARALLCAPIPLRRTDVPLVLQRQLPAFTCTVDQATHALKDRLIIGSAAERLHLVMPLVDVHRAQLLDTCCQHMLVGTVLCRALDQIATHVEKPKLDMACHQKLKQAQ
mmetsp:Transcript_44289/g.130587  ORF Transcript_44289/g.130587 Transcript_44289/m.130587 type:complete len:215 (-) Transcript_44289:405-1049(-)